jgi:hypothetical protein
VLDGDGVPYIFFIYFHTFTFPQPHHPPFTTFNGTPRKWTTINALFSAVHAMHHQPTHSILHIMSRDYTTPRQQLYAAFPVDQMF